MFKLVKQSDEGFLPSSFMCFLYLWYQDKITIVTLTLVCLLLMWSQSQSNFLMHFCFVFFLFYVIFMPMIILWSGLTIFKCLFSLVSDQSSTTSWWTKEISLCTSWTWRRRRWRSRWTTSFLPDWRLSWSWLWGWARPTRTLSRMTWRWGKACLFSLDCKMWTISWSDLPRLSPQIDLMPHDVITQLLRVLAIETKQEKAIINADPPDVALSGLEAFSFDYIVKWPLSLIINRFRAPVDLTLDKYIWRYLLICELW